MYTYIIYYIYIYKIYTPPPRTVNVSLAGERRKKVRDFEKVSFPVRSSADGYDGDGEGT